MSKEVVLQLAQDRLITRWQIENALQAQLVYESSLATALVKLGYIDEKSLMRFYSRRSGLQGVKDKLLKNVNYRITRLILPDLILRWRILPLGLRKGKLVVAAASPPSDLHVQEMEIYTRLPIRVVLTLERKLVKAIRYNYGIEMPSVLTEDISFPDGVARPDAAFTPSPRVPEVNPIHAAEKAQASVSRTLSDFEMPQDGDIDRILSAFPDKNKTVLPYETEIPDVESENFDDLNIPASEGQGSLANDSDVMTHNASAGPDFGHGGDGNEVFSDLSRFPSLKSLAASLGIANTRDEIVEVACDWLGGYYDASLFFTVKKSVGEPFKASGPLVKSFDLSNVSLALNLENAFKEAIESESPQSGTFEGDSGVDYLYTALLPNETRQTLIIPVILKGKAVGLLVGMTENANAAALPDDAGMYIAKLVSAAFETMILSRKVGV